MGQAHRNCAEDGAAGRQQHGTGYDTLPWNQQYDAAVSQLNDREKMELAELRDGLARREAAVRAAGLSQKEYWYVEQRWYNGKKVKELELTGCRETSLRKIKMSALKKISAVCGEMMKSAAESGKVRENAG